MERVTEKYIHLKICELNKSRMCVQYVTSREPAQQACDHMLIIANFFDSILCIVMFPSDASITEKEAVFVQYLKTNPPGRDTVQVVIAFVRLVVNY